jgi:transcriptional regulator with XRE-family HTH domain
MDRVDFWIDKDAVSDRIKARREELSLTQGDLGYLLDIGQQSISRYENGRVPDPDLLARLAIALNVSTDWLLGLSEDKERH